MNAWLLGAARVVLAGLTAEAAIIGTVRDAESGEPLPGAVVTLPDIDRTVLSDIDGRYVFRGLPAGPQHLTVKRIGYAPRTLHALVPAHGEVEINIALQPHPTLLRTVEVRPRIPVRGLEIGEGASFPDRGASLAAVRNHPLLSEPDALVALGGGEVVLNPESPDGIHIRGGASDQTAYLLDGIPVISPYHAAGTFTAWNPDALERLDVSSWSTAPIAADALSGTVAAVTRRPGDQFRAQGSGSTTQARATVDGPVGRSGAGYLLSARSGFPGFIAPQEESSYLRGRTGDLLGKIEVPAFGGRLRVLGYGGWNKLNAAAKAEDTTAPDPDPVRNEFTWHSRSVGARWSRRLSASTVVVQAWSASGDAEASWHPADATPMKMVAERQDEGGLMFVELSARGGTSIAGVRVQRSRTSYDVLSTGGDSDFALGARTPVAALVLGHQRRVSRVLRADVGVSAAAVAGSIYTDPRAELHWHALPVLTLTTRYTRSHQFSQSLRNAESVVGNVFPADLYVGVGAAGVPAARGDGGVLAAEYRPKEGRLVGAQAYLRHLHGLVLVAPRTGEPFTVDGFTTGSGVSRGFSLDAAASGARYGFLASYGWQRTRFRFADSSYVPGYASGHLLESGVVMFPSQTVSIRLGGAAALRRRATPVADAFEWEACNVLDRGCELGGSPRHLTDQLGSAKLPAYLRLDLGVRKHWHLGVGNRDVMIALFGTVTNIFGRNNVLTVTTDPLTGQRVDIDMRPRAPLVIGFDWRL